MWAKDGANISGARGTVVGDKATYHPQFCRNCHGGDTLGGLHGSNRAPDASTRTGKENVPQSIRFLNGATWRALGRPAFGTKTITCYTQTSGEASTSNVSGCSSHGGLSGTSYTNGSMSLTSTIMYDYSDY
jgi:hypothetical protein